MAGDAAIYPLMPQNRNNNGNNKNNRIARPYFEELAWPLGQPMVVYSCVFVWWVPLLAHIARYRYEHVRVWCVVHFIILYTYILHMHLHCTAHILFCGVVVWVCRSTIYDLAPYRSFSWHNGSRNAPRNGHHHHHTLTTCSSLLMLHILYIRFLLQSGGGHASMYRLLLYLFSKQVSFHPHQLLGVCAVYCTVRVCALCRGLLWVQRLADGPMSNKRKTSIIYMNIYLYIQM